MSTGKIEIVRVACTLLHEAEGFFLLDADNEDPRWISIAAAENNYDGTFSVVKSVAVENGLA